MPVILHDVGNWQTAGKIHVDVPILGKKGGSNQKPPEMNIWHVLCFCAVIIVTMS